MALLELQKEGLYCAAGDFYIDPWRGVDYAVITHAHADHARYGSTNYLASDSSELLLRTRLGQDISLETVPYGKSVSRNGVTISLHPAGHVLGSAQIRVEYKGEVWVASGDYKTDSDKTCAPFEPVRCHCFITEATFGLPIYSWQPTSQIASQINAWWNSNKSDNKTSVVFAYSLGKAQRILSEIDSSIGPIFSHGAVQKLNEVYASVGVMLPETTHVNTVTNKKLFSGSLVIAPPAAHHSGWLKKLQSPATSFASGWMLVRAGRRRRALDTGFVLSDHADWKGLLTSIKATEATKVLVTHGKSYPLVKYLSDLGYESQALETNFGDEHANDEDLHED